MITDFNNIQEEYIPTEKELWKVGKSVVEIFRDKRFLSVLYTGERAADIMYRYFSGQSLERIAEAHNLTRERIRQLCAKYLRQLLNQLTYFSKDVIEVNGYEKEEKVSKVPSTSNKRRPWSEEEKNRVVALKHTGHSYRTIAADMDRFAVDVREVYYTRLADIREGRVLAEAIEELTNEIEKIPPRDASMPWSEDSVAKLSTLRSQGMSIKEIAVELHRNYKDISSKLEELGIKTKYKKPTDLTGEAIENIIKQFGQGYSIADIADDHSLKQVDVVQLLIEQNLLPERLAFAGHPWDNSDIVELQSYIDRDYPISEIAYRLGRDYKEVTSQIYELLKSR